MSCLMEGSVTCWKSHREFAGWPVTWIGWVYCFFYSSFSFGSWFRWKLISVAKLLTSSVHLLICQKYSCESWLSIVKSLSLLLHSLLTVNGTPCKATGATGLSGQSEKWAKWSTLFDWSADRCAIEEGKLIKRIVKFTGRMAMIKKALRYFKLEGWLRRIHEFYIWGFKSIVLTFEVDYILLFL